MIKEMICIVCPQGCRLRVEKDEKTGEIHVENNLCNRGPIYAQKELTNPTRTLTATVEVKNGIHRRLPVKTNTEIPKDKNYEVMNAIKKVVVEAPIINGQVIIRDVCGLGVDLIATRDLPLQL